MTLKPTFAQENDPYQWLEEVDSEKALAWVDEWNKKSVDVITSQEGYDQLFEKNLEILNSTERIASPSIYGDYIYNFWQDQENERGIWRRTSRESYLSGNPDWEILLDIDKLAEKDDIKWVFKGSENDMGIWGSAQRTQNKVYQLISHRTSFYEGAYYFIENGELVKPELPDDIEMNEAVSKDGTRIPYFVVHAKSMKMNGENPTLLYAYGGFEIPMIPSYSATTGTNWLEHGGVYVLANIRGGGEFGPQWHQAGLKENRQLVYDDFHAVAEDLIERKITSPEKLGIYGGSNGGLLVGVAFTQRPDLYEAVVCAVPLLDMKRYNKLLAGASWMAEYGNPDIPEEWEYIKEYSPYHNLEKGKDYPEVFFTTSTRDDRVHPGHARKMVAKMSDLGYKIYYFENTKGGHAGASTNEQRARMIAQLYSYLQMKLME
jgi:prolyl oligopeptidase PreP (S9A serine peptidase family)